MRRIMGRVSAALIAATAVATLSAAELLSARVVTDAGEEILFRLSGENRDNVIGGTLELGPRSFTITHVSRYRLIGARRFEDDAAGGRLAEFAVFSSSFSTQTATGQPWIWAERYMGCDEPYNSFLAIYRVEGESAIAALGTTPYPKLTEDAAASRSSLVYCFVSAPPAGG